MELRTASGISDRFVAARPRKHSLTIAGHRTSISLEDAFWTALRQLADADGKSLAELVSEIDSQRGEAGLSSAIRVYVLARAQEEAPSS